MLSELFKEHFMPCDSSHLAATELEKECCKIVQLLDELDSGYHVDPNVYGCGYDKRVYSKCSSEMADQLTKKLCDRLKKTPEISIPTYSLEMQIWWRDHQKIDLEKN